MTPPKAEHPFQGSGSVYDRPPSTPDVGGAGVEHMLRAELVDPDAPTSFAQLWDDEDAFLSRLQGQVEARRQTY